MEIRNIAIIAHVDHGKTTITDELMKQTGTVSEDVSMDNDDLEKERGITIYAKNASLTYKDTKINIVDTPGHADFSSEVERVLRAIDSVILVVDAKEGPMPQTRFVLKKALELGLKPVVVINKIDKPDARIEEVEEMIFELFLDLGANDEQLEFKTVYASAKQGIAKLNVEDDAKDIFPLLDTILKEVKSPQKTASKLFSIQPFNLAYDNFLGRLAVARIYEGQVNSGDNVIIKKRDGSIAKGKITKLFVFKGTQREEVAQAQEGDIVIIAGLPDIYIGETICKEKEQIALANIQIDQPTITLNFLVNDSPFAGHDGEFVTNLQIKERLEKELEVNVGLKIDFSSSESYKVSGRGELHIAILLENMRREGYEIQVSQPKVIIKEENNQKLEPFEEVLIDVPEQYAGTVIKKLGKRKGVMSQMKEDNNLTRIIFEVPTRGLLGYRSQFIVDTRGEGIFCSRFLEFRPFVGTIDKRTVGSMISTQAGKALGFSLDNLQKRGELYINPGTEVYEGMVIGNTSKGDDISANPIKGKELTNIRSSSSDDAIQLIPPIELTIEKGLEVMGDDEYLEITPKNIRLRKKYLTETDRIRSKRKGA
ncbi:MAG: translational GTPase TypA [Patescibacteria group bacterium]|nr:translational GTPase TypA [Patescibacteria group bacterium]